MNVLRNSKTIPGEIVKVFSGGFFAKMILKNLNLYLYYFAYKHETFVVISVKIWC